MPIRGLLTAIALALFVLAAGMLCVYCFIPPQGPTPTHTEVSQ